MELTPLPTRVSQQHTLPINQRTQWLEELTSMKRLVTRAYTPSSQELCIALATSLCGTSCSSFRQVSYAKWEWSKVSLPLMIAILVYAEAELTSERDTRSCYRLSNALSQPQCNFRSTVYLARRGRQLHPDLLDWQCDCTLVSLLRSCSTNTPTDWVSRKAPVESSTMCTHFVSICSWFDAKTYAYMFGCELI